MADPENLEHTVGQGKEFYSDVLAHPERAPIGEHINAPAFRGAAIVVYWDRFQQDIHRRAEAEPGAAP